MIFIRDFLVDQKILISPSAPQNPTVSIVLPTYRRYQTGQLERSIRSVLAQKFTDFELLVIDDGSTDGSYELIEQFRATDPRVIHVRHEQNSGIHTVRLNEGIELARGKYLAFQFDDDCWRDNALSSLVTEIQRHTEPVCVVGKAMYHNYLGQGVLPRKDVEIVMLYEMNCLPNNGMLFPRSLMDTYGMYDPHIGMRRLCDWDLWLRLIKHIPFITLDQIISDVYEGNVGAIGVTVPWDVELFRYLHSIERNHLLTPDRWRNYEIDTLRIGDVELSTDFRRRLYEEQIVPYYFKFRHAFPKVAGFNPTDPHRKLKTVMYTKQSYDVCNEVTITHYDELTNRRGSYKSYYQKLSQVNPGWEQESDLVLLMRTVEDEAVDLVEQAHQENHPVGLYLDDDLFTFHEYGSEFDYLAPGTPYYRNLQEIASRTDAVMVTNEFIGQSVREFTPRVIPHNNTIPDEMLPVEVHPRNPHPLRIAYAGGWYRIEEFRTIWDALIRISREYGDALKFSFWGLDVSDLPKLASPVEQREFTFSYYRYLSELKKANFDVMLIPMLDHPRPRLGKSLIKYYETAAAGALGIFSDVPQYAALPAGLTCLKAQNDAESWYLALKQAIEMPSDEFDQIRARCEEHVREEYAVSAQINLHEAALRAVEFHARTRQQRSENGRPIVMYVMHSAHFGGGEIQLWRRLHLMQQYGVQPVVVIPDAFKDSENAHKLKEALDQKGIELESAIYQCFDEPRSPEEHFSELERDDIRALLERVRPALVHSLIFIPSFGQMCHELNIPHVSTQYAINDEFAWDGSRPKFTYCQVVQSDTVRYTNRWADLLGVAKFCSRDMAPDDLFQLGQINYLRSNGQPPAQIENRSISLVVTGTFQERKQQLEVIETVGRLKKQGFKLKLAFYGYTHFFPDYMKKCREAIEKWGLKDDVAIHDFTFDLVQVLSDADMLLSLSTFESFPGSIKDAMAAGVLVVATPVGGISELIIDGISGILTTDTTVEALVAGIQRALVLSSEKRWKIIQQARRVGRQELHAHRAANDVFQMYNLAFDLLSGNPDLPVVGKEVSSSQRSKLSNAQRLKSYGRARSKAPTEQPGSLTPLGSGLRYMQAVDEPNWVGIDVLLEPNARPASGKLILRVRSQRGDFLRQDSCELGRGKESSWIAFRFEPIRNAAGQVFQLDFTPIEQQPEALLSLYEKVPPRHKFFRLVFRALQMAKIRLPGRQLYCRLWHNQED